MNGSLVLCNEAGRALRRRVADVRLSDVVDASGDFQAGQLVYVCFRGRDGGQYAVATGACQHNSDWLQQRLGPHACTRRRCADGDGDELVLLAANLRLLWPTDS